MLYAEVFAGSSKLWFFEVWSLLVTFPLYASHLLFYLNLGFKTRRVSIPQLYVWGCLFALYEAPITKVLWSGYPVSAGPAFGQVLGISILEFLTLVFFWHPVLAFVVPVLVFEALSGRMLDSHAGFFSSKGWKTALYGCAVVGSLFLGFNSQFDPRVVLGSFLGSLVLIGIVQGLSRALKQGSGMEGLRLGPLSFALLALYLLVLYAVTWGLIFPDKQGSLAQVFLIIAVAGAFVLVLLKSPAVKSVSFRACDGKAKDVVLSWGLFFLLSVLWALIPEVGALLATVLFLLVPLVGAVLFLYALRRLLLQ